MRQSFNLDGLVDYRTDAVPETTRVVNPAYRGLDGQVRKKVALLNRKIAEFGAINLDDGIEPKDVEVFAQRKSALHEAIAELQQQVDELKLKRRATKRHITYNELPEDASFVRLSTQSKHFIDTIKMIAYRAETAMVQIVREKMTRHDDARSLMRAIYKTEVDLATLIFVPVGIGSTRPRIRGKRELRPRIMRVILNESSATEPRKGVRVLF
jgi:hypothetical protein